MQYLLQVICHKPRQNSSLGGITRSNLSLSFVCCFFPFAVLSPSHPTFLTYATLSTLSLTALPHSMIIHATLSHTHNRRDTQNKVTQTQHCHANSFDTHTHTESSHTHTRFLIIVPHHLSHHCHTQHCRTSHMHNIDTCHKHTNTHDIFRHNLVKSKIGTHHTAERSLFFSPPIFLVASTVHAGRSWHGVICSMIATY